MKSCAGALCFSFCLFFIAACGAAAVRPTYMALGDSFALGEGASKASETSYAALFYRYLEEQAGEALSLRSFAVADEMTSSMISRGQLAKALAELRFRNQDDATDNDVIVITVQIGFQDLFLLIEGQPCAPPRTVDDQACARAISSALEEASLNIPVVLRALRVAAGPEAEILVLDCFNPYSGSGKAQEEVLDYALPALNTLIKNAAEAPAVAAERVALFDEFRGRGAELTHVTRPEETIFPNDAGHRLIADLLEGSHED